MATSAVTGIGEPSVATARVSCQRELYAWTPFRRGASLSRSAREDVVEELKRYNMV